jgi:hypothetical protein
LQRTRNSKSLYIDQEKEYFANRLLCLKYAGKDIYIDASGSDKNSSKNDSTDKNSKK